jgi:phenylalanyl-tRNA synthetase beta chain
LPENWQMPPQPTDYYHLKGQVEAILKRFGIDKYKMKPGKNADLQDAVIITVNNKKIVELGKVKPSIAKHFGINKSVYYADFFWDNLMDEIKKNSQVKYKEIPKFPSVRRDLALEVDKNVTYKDLYDAAFDTEKKLLVGVNLFDVYEGDKIAEGKKSYALSFILQDPYKTLNDKQIDKTMKKIYQKYEQKFGAKLRQ